MQQVCVTDGKTPLSQLCSGVNHEKNLTTVLCHTGYEHKLPNVTVITIKSPPAKQYPAIGHKRIRIAK